MLAYVLSRVLVTLPRVKTLSHMQADHHCVGFEAHIYLILRCVDVFVQSHRIMNNNARIYAHIIPFSLDLVRGRGVGCIKLEWDAKKA